MSAIESSIMSRASGASSDEHAGGVRLAALSEITTQGYA